MGRKCPKCNHENPDNTKFCGNCAAPLDKDARDAAATETLATPIEELTRGGVLSKRYEIIEELGKGGMGKVYKAFDRDIDEDVALKLIRPEISANKKIIACVVTLPLETGIHDWDKFCSSLRDLIDVFSTDPYWLLYRKSLDYVEKYSRKTVELAQKYNLESQFFLLLRRLELRQICLYLLSSFANALEVL